MRLALLLAALLPASASAQSLSPFLADAPKISGQAPARTLSFNGLAVPAYAFSSQETLSGRLASVIGKTEKTLDLALYVFNLPELAQALVAAHGRKVKLRVILDHHNAYPAAGKARSKEIQALLDAKIEVRTLRGRESRSHMHNKFGIYDSSLVNGGSFNWTVPADTRHYENLVFRDDPAIIAEFQAYWDWMWSISTPIDSETPQPGSPRGPPAPGGPALSYKGRSWPTTAFSPRAGTTGLLVSAIDLAERGVDVAMFSFYSMEIGQALVRAKEKGRAVRVVLDKGQARNSPVTKLLLDNKIDVKFTSGRGGAGVMHHKFGVFDGELLGTGSFNYSNNAEFNNYESTLFSTHPNDLQGFGREFEALYQLASPGV